MSQQLQRITGWPLWSSYYLFGCNQINHPEGRGHLFVFISAVLLTRPAVNTNEKGLNKWINNGSLPSARSILHFLRANEEKEQRDGARNEMQMSRASRAGETAIHTDVTDQAWCVPVCVRETEVRRKTKYRFKPEPDSSGEICYDCQQSRYKRARCNPADRGAPRRRGGAGDARVNAVRQQT